MEPVFSGFGSPVASPGGFMPVQTPDDKTKTNGMLMDTNAQSPLLFQRTPGMANALTPAAESGKRFSDWVMSTSPYTGQKTPPTVSMMSVRADENTPPHLQDAAAAGSCGGKQHFQAWLRATSSNSYTPRRSPGAATPPAAPVPTPAGTPMSASGLPASAVSPAAAEPRSRPLFDLGPDASDDDSDEADDEATTTVGANQLAAAAARMHAALAAVAGRHSNAAAAAPAGGGSGHAMSFTPPRAPANTPHCGGSPAFALGQQQPQSPQQLAGDSLATPMSHLSMARAGGSHGAHSFDGFGFPSQQRGAAAHTAGTPGRSHSQAPPASPVDKVIGLMMGPGAGHSHHQQQQRTPSRLAAPPPSPEQQVIQLMVQQQQAAHELAAGPVQDRTEQQAAAVDAAAAEEQQQDVDDAEAGDEFYSGSEYGDSSQSDDEIDVAELQQLCGATAEHGTPIDDIIGMLLTPELKGTSFTPRATAAGAAGAEDGVGPRVLFGDDEH
ncbi:hypothetical protein OEZ85_008680 [Tetradesmus obliquus]|uniref:Uncharacterized protein n=1 Tax=Tetradesmus obliquus TaxID=3088 RepID=A0ABY8TLI0_TETOB|nr:hypothetical protein OEZ85_008680 [Tetradesmus obliquus]